MNSREYLNGQVEKRLGGDRSRVAELFEDDNVFNQLMALGKDGDWFQYKAKTFDGWYLVKSEHGYEVYYQERGGITSKRLFSSLKAAAAYFFTENTYVRTKAART